MKFNFRLVQAATSATMFGYWAVRYVSHPHHLHLSMLIMGVVAVALSELGYRSGKQETESKLEAR